MFTPLPSPLPYAQLPEVIETKDTLNGPTQRFHCRLVERDHASMIVVFISDRERVVADVVLPAGTVTFATFWMDRPYNVYHWVTPRGRTIAHYFNVADRTELGARTLRFRDLVVDVLVTPDGRVQVLDEDEIPPDTVTSLRAAIELGKRAILDGGFALRATIEISTTIHWPHIFGGPRET